MDKRTNMKWILLGYFVVALVTYLSMYRFEKLESMLDVASNNQVIVMGAE